MNGNINCSSNIITNSNSKIYPLDISTNATGYYGNTSTASNYISYMFSGAQNSFNSAIGSACNCFGAGHVIIKSGDVNPNGVIYGAGNGSVLYASDLILGGGVVCTGYGNNGSVPITGYGGNVKLYPGWSDAGQLNNPGNIIFYKALGTTGRGNVVNAQGNTISGTSSLTNPTSYYNQVYQGVNGSAINTYSEAVRIVGSNGYVGIGTSNPTAPLTVIGTGTGGGNTPVSNFLNSTGVPCVLIGSAINCNLYINYNSNLNYSQLGIFSGSATLNITSSNFGINTPTPAYTLDVYGNLNISGGANRGTINKLIVLYDGNASENVTTASNFYGFGIQGYQLRYQVPLSASNLWFCGSPTTPIVYFDPNGVVNAQSYYKCGTGAGSTNTNSYPGLFIGATSTQNAVIVGDILGKSGYTMGMDQSDSKFKIQVGATLGTGNFTAPIMTIYNNSVGIGTTTPAYTLEINGNIGRSNNDLNFVTATDGKGFGFVSQVAGVQRYHLVMKNLANYPADDNIISLGVLGARWSTVYSANGTIQTSDELDKNHVPLTYGLSDLMKVSTIKYKWKSQDDLPEDDPKKNYEYFGICARELNELFPELVYNEQEPYQVNYSEIIPVCINAIKDLKKEKDDEISILRQEIAQLETFIKSQFPNYSS